VTAGDAQATFAATLVDEWVRAGVRHAVVAPGSRSTPLAVALDADDRIAVHVFLDERSASFCAVGIGRATGVPAVVVTTSGTAAAECHAAVLEASYGRVPLVVCTADRPPELQGVGAPQTVDQVGLYGRAVRWAAEPGVPDPATAGTWRSLGSRAVAEATGARPGPVHLDLAFRDPLVGQPGELPPGRDDGAPWHRIWPLRWPGTTEAVAASLRSARGVIVAGAGAARGGVASLAKATGWPVLADPLSGCRVPGAVSAFDSILRVRAFAEAHRPDVVVRVGALPASKVLGEWLAGSGARIALVERAGTFLDPDRLAADVLPGGPAVLADLARRLEGIGEPSWGAAWRTADDAAQAAIARVLAGREEVTEPAVARSLLAALPDGATLVVSSSMPVRDLEWYGAARDGVRVLANRGANGIDGVLSTAVGVALASGGPTALLIGDLALLHDAGGLLGLAEREVDLAIVVVDNRGGGIFSFLPQARALPPPRFERLLATPHGVDLPSLVAVHGVAALRVHDADGLVPALTAAVHTPGPLVVVAPTDRVANVGVHDELHAAVATAVDRR
jgi:2-succinyl-5-enolpyruvyl-6-hydroxy-3-cyclohexene-1-carboxylate synthase